MRTISANAECEAQGGEEGAKGGVKGLAGSSGVGLEVSVESVQTVTGAQN